jgi:hypothetical protein
MAEQGDDGIARPSDDSSPSLGQNSYIDFDLFSRLPPSSARGKKRAASSVRSSTTVSSSPSSSPPPVLAPSPNTSSSPPPPKKKSIEELRSDIIAHYEETYEELHTPAAIARDSSDDYFNLANDSSSSRRSSIDPSSRNSGSISDLTVSSFAASYFYPLPYIADMIMQFGVVRPPLDVSSRLGDICSGEELFALLEVVNTIPGHDVADYYYTGDIGEACEEFGWDLRAVLKICQDEEWSLPFGVRTVLRTDQIGELISMLGNGLGDGESEEEED